MCNQEPTVEDIRKIHAEINQLANQRFLLTTLSVTVFGLVMTMQVPKDNPIPGSSVGGIHYILSLISSVVVFFMYLLSHFIKGMQRICTTYLVVTKSSVWEMDWNDFRKKPHFGYTKPQTAVFLLINGLILLFPFVFALVYDLQLQPYSGMLVLLAVGVPLEILIYSMGFRNAFELHTSALCCWEEVKGKKLTQDSK